MTDLLDLQVARIKLTCHIEIGAKCLRLALCLSLQLSLSVEHITADACNSVNAVIHYFVILMLQTFLPRDALLSAVYAVVVCLSVCVCVCVCVLSLIHI